MHLLPLQEAGPSIGVEVAPLQELAQLRGNTLSADSREKALLSFTSKKFCHVPSEAGPCDCESSLERPPPLPGPPPPPPKPESRLDPATHMQAEWVYTTKSNSIVCLTLSEPQQLVELDHRGLGDQPRLLEASAGRRNVAP